MAKAQARRSIAKNRKAHHSFHILEELECGIELVGTEVKSLRSGQCSLQEAFGRLRGGELWLLGATIPVYSHGNIHNHEPARERKLLVHKREIAKWEKRVREKGITLVPLEVYFQGSRVKVLMALCRGKKLFDKRDDQRKKDAQRDIDRETRARERG